MPIVLYSDKTFPLTDEEVQLLWKNTIEQVDYTDDLVTVKCVSQEEIQRLNNEYRKKNAPTNVLTFSYPAAEEHLFPEHDVALSMTVADREAKARNVGIRDYVALLLVHAFLHVAGLDHERSTKEEENTKKHEQAILAASNFLPVNL